MLSGILPKLNTTVCCRIQEVITRQQAVVSKPLVYRNPGLSSGHKVYRKSMATSPSKAVLGDVYVDELVSNCGSGIDFTKPSGVYFKGRTQRACLRAGVNLSRPRYLCGPLNLGSSPFDSTLRSRSSGLLHGPLLKNLCTSSSSCSPAGAAHGVPDEQIATSPISPDQTVIVGGKTLKMLSGSCYLPHPDKEETGGEDAHFICTDEQAIGVADGVGGWADVGVNAGLFARELISNSVRAVQEEPKGSFDPVRVLEKAHSGTKAQGSSTACIIALTNKGLHAINLGDSGFIVVRDGCTIFRSPVQQHDFNFTYQLESGNGGDLPSSGEVFTVPVAPGDVIVAGTDGLFDNLYNNDIAAVVVDAVRAGLEPQETAQKIAALARERALDRTRSSPFAVAALEAGFRYFGGKLDDITVVVSYITSSVSEF